MADLITQSPTLTATELENIMNVSSRIMYPYSEDVMIVTTGIQMTGTTGKVEWSCAEGEGATANAVGGSYSVPTSIAEDGAYYVSAKVSIDLKPMVGWLTYNGDTGLSNDRNAIMEMEEELYLRPRTGSTVDVSCS